MNPLTKVLLLLFVVFVLNSCLSNQLPVASSAPDNNNAYQVDYLFEHEGCKVYRFRDMGNYVYFTNCPGEVTSVENDSTQTRVINKVNIQPSK